MDIDEQYISLKSRSNKIQTLMFTIEMITLLSTLIFVILTVMSNTELHNLRLLHISIICLIVSIVAFIIESIIDKKIKKQLKIKLNQCEMLKHKYELRKESKKLNNSYNK